MQQTPDKRGSTKAFDDNWQTRRESHNNYWTPSTPSNQLQLAFSQHWKVFEEIMQRPPGRSLEVGCGRGSLSSHFAANGWETILLDYSHAVATISKSIFENNKHKGDFICGDANNIPFGDDLFDAVTSIGLLEHFENPAPSIKEQWRVLKPGGWMLAYIVPHKPDNLQRYFNWINTLLKGCFRLFGRKGEERPKEPIYRNDYGSERYLPTIEALSPEKTIVTGMYSMPMISHSPEFPFSLLPPPMEKLLTRIFMGAIKIRRLLTGRSGWLCSERYGQAFLIAAKKRRN